MLSAKSIISRQTHNVLNKTHYLPVQCFSTKNKTKKDVYNPNEDIYKHFGKTLALPETSYPLRPEGGIYKSEMNQRDEVSEGIYIWQKDTSNITRRKSAKGVDIAVKNAQDGKLPKFVLHDGPPFANGPLHMGHFLNKTLKDVFNRYKLMRGFEVDFYPGWDCHGLPIELKAITTAQKKMDIDEMEASVDNNSVLSPQRLSAIEIRQTAQKFAYNAAMTQRSDLESWGLMGNVDQAYYTMAPDYEAKQIKLIGELYKKNMLYRALMPVHWSPTTQTALAEAELEYDDHVSKALYATFPIVNPASLNNYSELANLVDPFIVDYEGWNNKKNEFFQKSDEVSNKYLEETLALLNVVSGKTANPTIPIKTNPNSLSLLIWTTTPWTLSANRAVAFNKDLHYSAISVKVTSQVLVSGKSKKKKNSEEIPNDKTFRLTLEETHNIIIGKERIDPLISLWKQSNNVDLHRIVSDPHTIWEEVELSETEQDEKSQKSQKSQKRGVKLEHRGIDVTVLVDHVKGEHLEGVQYTSPLTSHINDYILSDAKNVVSITNSGSSVSTELLTTDLDLDTIYRSKPKSKTNLLPSVNGQQMKTHGYLNDNTILLPVFPLLPGTHVTSDAGTGLVHTAPGHGADDFKLGQQFSVPAACPVDEFGDYQDGLGVLTGLNVLNSGNESSISLMNGSGNVIYCEEYGHRYPLDWRTKKPVIFRATEQWFCSLDTVRGDAINAIQNISFVPDTGKVRLGSFVENRTQWCISRQRLWGLPIPVMYTKGKTEMLFNSEVIDHVSTVIGKCGSMAWWILPSWMLLPAQYRGQVNPKYSNMSREELHNSQLELIKNNSHPLNSVNMPLLSSSDGKSLLDYKLPNSPSSLEKLFHPDSYEDICSTITTHTNSEVGLLPYDYYLCDYVIGEETMDVWMDSGSSWYSTLFNRNISHTTLAEPDVINDVVENYEFIHNTQSADLIPPADLYVEGSDQHRGWFQSSLLTSCAVTKTAPMKTIISHGFVVDSTGAKMSKSVGNGVEPNVVIAGMNNIPPEPVKGKLSDIYTKFASGIGVDGARLWACSVDYTRDAVLSSTVVTNAIDVMRKWRSTVRFIVGSMQYTRQNDPDNEDSKITSVYNPLDKNSILSYDDLTSLDKYLLHHLHTLVTSVTACYESHQIHRAVNHLNVFMVNIFSAQYLDIVKDRLYCEDHRHHSRLSSLTVMTHTLEVLLKLFAPLIPHASQELYKHCDDNLKRFFNFGLDSTNSEPSPYIFSSGWVEIDEKWHNPTINNYIESLFSVKSAINKTMEKCKVFHNSKKKDDIIQDDSGITPPKVNLLSEAEIIITLPLSTSQETLNYVSEMIKHIDFRAYIGSSVCSILVGDFPDAPEGTFLFSMVNGRESIDYSGDLTVVMDGKNSIVPIQITLMQTLGDKCPRCWRYSNSDSVLSSEKDLVSNIVSGAGGVTNVLYSDFIPKSNIIVNDAVDTKTIEDHSVKKEICLCARCSEVIQ